MGRDQVQPSVPATSDLATARRLFFEYDGSRFYMSRDGADRVYAKYAVPKAVEQEWFAELTASKLDGLSAPGNWKSVNFLLSHGLSNHVSEVLAAKPLGQLWERVAYSELLLKLVRATRRDLDQQTYDEAIEYVIAEGQRSLRACRSERTRSRVERLIEAAQSAR